MWEEIKYKSKRFVLQHHHIWHMSDGLNETLVLRDDSVSDTRHGDRESVDNWDCSASQHCGKKTREGQINYAKMRLDVLFMVVSR